MNESMNKIPPVSGLEYHEFAAYYAEEALRKIQYALDNMDGLRRKANTALEAVRSIQIKKEQYGESYLPEMMCDDILTALEGIDSMAMRMCSSIYHRYSQPIYLDPFRPLDVAEEEDLARFGEAVFGIRGALSKGKFLISLPMLGRRIPVSSALGSGVAITSEYTTIFAADVSRVVKKLIAKLGEDYQDFRYKTISFFFIYNTLNGNMLDADSHDTKAVVDAIACLLPCGDAADYCDFSFKNRVSSVLSPGTYVCVSRGSSSFQTDEMLAEFESAFSLK